jgi:hypothetical protein
MYEIIWHRSATVPATMVAEVAEKAELVEPKGGIHVVASGQTKVGGADKGVATHGVLSAKR